MHVAMLCLVYGNHRLDMPRYTIYYIALQQDTSRMSNIESNNSQNGDLEDYNNISD